MKENRKRRTRAACIAVCAAALLVAFLGYENQHLVTTEYAVQTTDWTQALDGYRIVQISDLHNAVFGKENCRLVEKVRAAKPDMIAVTGDFADSRRTDTAVCVALSRELVKICPVYYVSGNHETRLPASVQESFYRDLEGAGVTVLRDRAETVTRDGASFAVVGVWHSSLWDDTLSSILRTLPEKMPHIVLAHAPHRLRFYAEAGADLVLCGHAHGGQIRLPFVGGLLAPGQGFFPKYTEGVYTKDNTQMVVSRGLGNSIFPFRIGNNPEIVAVTVRKSVRTP